MSFGALTCFAGNAQNYVKMGELQRNEEANRNYTIGVPFGGLEDTRSHHKEDGANMLEWAADQRAPTAGRRGPEPKRAYLLEASSHRPPDHIMAVQ